MDLHIKQEINDDMTNEMMGHLVTIMNVPQSQSIDPVLNSNIFSLDLNSDSINNLSLKTRKQIFMIYKLAAEQGYMLAQNYLGYCYEKGIGIEKNEIEAVKWYTLAAEQGHSEAKYKLAQIYENKKKKVIN